MPFLTIIIIAKLISPEAFGELTLYFIAYEFLIIFIGNNISAVSRIDFFNLNRSSLFVGKKAHIIGSIIIAISLLIFGLAASSIFLFNLLYFSILVFASLFRTVSFFVLADLQCKQESLVYAKLNLVYVLTLNIAFLLLIYFYKDVNTWFYSLVIGAFIQMVISFYILKREPIFNYAINVKINSKRIIKEFSGGLIFIPQAIGFWIKFGIDRILLLMLTTEFILGNYMFSFQLSFPIVILSTAINLFMTPKINLYLKNKKKHEILKKCNLFTVLIFVSFIVVYFFSKIVITNFYLDSYSKSLDYLFLICFSMFFHSSMLVYLNIFYYIGKKKFVSYYIFITSVLNFIFGYFSIKLGGVYGLLILNIIINSLSFFFVFFKIRLTFLKKQK